MIIITGGIVVLCETEVATVKSRLVSVTRLDLQSEISTKFSQQYFFNRANNNKKKL